jgi:signal transduction histidine kinase
VPNLRVGYLVSLAVFTFGAMLFTLITLAYWKQLKQRQGGPHPLLFCFSLCSAGAFLLNVSLQLPAWVLGHPIARAAAGSLLTVLASLLPPLLLHLLAVRRPVDRPSGRWAGKGTLAAMYVASLAAAVWSALADTGLLTNAWDEQLRIARAALLIAVSALGMAALQGQAAAKPADVQATHWIQGLLVVIGVSAGASIPWPDSGASVVPDYALLAFFAAILYFDERLVFLDIVIKRGIQFGLVLCGLMLFFAVGWPWLTSSAERASLPWLAALLLMPLFPVAPWIGDRLDRFIDRVWLKRAYTLPDAERTFADTIQAAATEQELHQIAEGEIGRLFQSRAILDTGPGPVAPPQASLTVPLVRTRAVLTLHPRADGIPFLSGDRRLLESMARTLDVVVENLRFREAQRLQREHERELTLLASRAELKALRAQINPHFLFNALNTIAALISERPQQADETVDRLAQVFRYTLSHSEREWVSLGEEVEFIEAYLQIEQARFGDRFNVRYQIQPESKRSQMPAMSLQPLVENAVKHGVAQVEGPAWVELNASTPGEILRVEVKNNGPTFPEDEAVWRPEAHALSNIRARLKGYYGDRACLSCRSHCGVTSAVLELPLEAPVTHARVGR